MKKTNKKLLQAVTMSLLMATSSVVWANDFNDGFNKNLTLDSGNGHYKGVEAPGKIL